MAKFVNPYNVTITDFDTSPEKIEFHNTDLSDPEIVNQKANRRRRSPVMVEFSDPRVTIVDITRTLEAGLNIIKFRMAFSTKAEKIRLLSTLNRAVLHCIDKTGGNGYTYPVATCASLKTWVKKTGTIESHKGDTNYIEIIKDSEVILTCDHSFINKCVPSRIFVDHDHLATDVHVGMEINFEHGDIVMNCLEKIDEKSIKCLVCKGGQLKNLQTVFFRNFKPTTPYLSQVDIDFLKFCVRYQIDIITIFYARDGNMIDKIKHIISKSKIKPLFYSAICNQDGLNNIDGIIKASDGIIFARDYLAYELDKSNVYRLPRLQKWVAGKCQQAGKPIFISEVFEHLIADGILSDAEIADVTNALMDGITGFLLRECIDVTNTLSAVYALNDICCQIEPLTFDKNIFWRMLKEPKLPVNAADAAAISCVAAANQSKARVIIISTVTGRTIKSLLWLRPSCIVIAVCTKAHVARLLYTCRNIVPLMFKGNEKKNWYEAEDSIIYFAAQYAVSRGWMVYGDPYVSLQRSCEAHLFCDMVRIWTVTFAKKLLIECEDGTEEAEKNIDDQPVSKKKKKKKKKKEVNDKDEEINKEEIED